MAKKKKSTTKKKGRKPSPSMLGTGGASKAGKAILSRKARIKCAVGGGKWSGGKCTY